VEFNKADAFLRKW